MLKLKLAAVAALAVLVYVFTRKPADAPRTPDGGGTPGRLRTDLDGLHPQFAAKVRRWLNGCAAEGLEVRVTETVRDAARQAQLQAGGASTTSVSLHEAGLAVDFIVTRWLGQKVDAYGAADMLEMQALARAAELAKAEGLLWGGDWRTFRDGYHIEMPTRLTHAEARRRYQGAPGREFALA